MKTNTFDNSQYFSENELIKQFQLLSKKDIAKILSVSTKTINNWVYKGFMPQPDIRSKRLVRWKLNNLREFLDNPIGWRDTHAKIKT